jgi:hypothetical protein
LARIAFEVITMFFRIGDNTFLAVQLLSGGRPGQWAQGAQPGYGAPAPYGSQAPWGYPTGAGETAGAPTPAPYSAGPPPANYGQQQPNYGQSQAPYGQPQPHYEQPHYEQPQDSSGGQYPQPEPPSQPGQQGWGPTNPKP